ncbi:hypothetical protein GCM10009799_40980 [Nocardiopsis rhodophaea]|uniref:Intracellular septation protein A n=1 Tax=Nocardiopsis rhodophaea TaxID=280238 RepID=A0ABN2TIB6_9ACTN
MKPRALVTGLMWDVGLPVATFYAARLLGFDAFIALAAGAVAAVLRLLTIAVRQRRLDGFSVLMAAVFVVALVLGLITADARMMLVRDSLVTATVGAGFLGSCAVGRPLVYTFARRMNADDPRRLAAWDARWPSDPGFRSAFVRLTLVWGSGLIAEAVLRLPLVFALPVDVMAGLSTAITVITIALLSVWTVHYVRRRKAATAAEAAPVSSETGRQPAGGRP